MNSQNSLRLQRVRKVALTALKRTGEKSIMRGRYSKTIFNDIDTLQKFEITSKIRGNLNISGNIRVFFRIRPMLEAVGEQAIKMDEMDDWAIDVLQPGGKKTSHGADRVLTTTLTQKEVFFRSFIKVDIFLVDLRGSLPSNNELH